MLRVALLDILGRVSEPWEGLQLERPRIAEWHQVSEEILGRLYLGRSANACEERSQK